MKILAHVSALVLLIGVALQGPFSRELGKFVVPRLRQRQEALDTRKCIRVRDVNIIMALRKFIRDFSTFNAVIQKPRGETGSNGKPGGKPAEGWLDGSGYGEKTTLKDFPPFPSGSETYKFSICHPSKSPASVMLLECTRKEPHRSHEKLCI